MGDTIRVLILGTGQMGAGIARLVLKKQGVSLVGAFARRPGRAGKDLGIAIGLGNTVGIAIADDLRAVIGKTRPHVAIQATCSRLDDALHEIQILVDSGVNVISIAEEMAFPAAKHPLAAKQLHQRAVSHGVAVLGTGINPGFVLDLLVIMLTGVCAEVQSISAKRINDLSPYGPTVLASQGVGLTGDEFEQGLKDGTVVGHFGFDESIHMIASVLGWDIESVQQTRQPIISQVTRETAYVTVAAGQVAGCLHTATAYAQGRAVIQLVHPQQILPELENIETGDIIEIIGTPHVRLAGCPEIPGGQGTAALAVNMIPRVLNAAPGLYSMADLPVPGAMLGDARRYLH